MIERLPVPFGLVRYGVAPIIPNSNSPRLVYDKIAQSPGFTFLGERHVGRDVSLEHCKARTRGAVRVGAESDRRLGVPNEGIGGQPYRNRVRRLYNGHSGLPDRSFDLAEVP